MTMGPDWTLLPAELLQKISEKVTSLADYICFRAVCHPWRSASSQRPRHLPPQLPWLMLPYRLDGSDDSTRLFYDLSASKIHRLDLPETREADICGSSHGWLVLCKGCQDMALLNPITHTTIPLPRFAGAPSPLGIPPLYASSDEHFFENWNPNVYAMNPSSRLKVKKAILTSSPADHNCMIFVFTFSIWKLAFCKIGDKCWTVIEFHCHMPWEYEILDFTYRDDCLYTISKSGTMVYDLRNRSRVMLNCSLGRCGIYLVDGVSQDILLTSCVGHTNVDGVIEEKCPFVVYKLINDGEPESAWIRVQDIGQNIIFLCGRNSVCLSSANIQFPNWRANCLCYQCIDPKEENGQHIWPPLCNQSIKLARLDNGIVIDLAGDLDSFQDNGKMQLSLWLTPSVL